MKQETFDVKRKFVRIKGVMPNGFIEFEFAVGEPEVFVELVMPKTAFDEFCRNNQVETLDAAAPQAADAADAGFRWSLRQATHQRFR